MRYRERLKSNVLICIILMALCGCSNGLIQTETGCPENAPGLIKEGLRGEELDTKQLSLVFVGGPSDISDDIANYLISRNIRSAFFMTGSALLDNKAIAAQISAIGHLVGNYGYSGKDLIASRSAVAEVRSTDLLLLPHIKGDRFLFYPPQGQFNERLRRLLNDAGLNKYVGPILPVTDRLGSGFTDDRACWETGVNVSDCAQNYLDAIRQLERGIITFHDTSEQSLSLLQTLIPILEAEQFSFVSLLDIPSISFSLQASGATINPGNEETCNDYE